MLPLHIAYELTHPALSDNYQNYAEIFYERARRYAEIMEMKVRHIRSILFPRSLMKLGPW